MPRESPLATRAAIRGISSPSCHPTRQDCAGTRSVRRVNGLRMPGILAANRDCHVIVAVRCADSDQAAARYHQGEHEHRPPPVAVNDP